MFDTTRVIAREELNYWFESVQIPYGMCLGIWRFVDIWVHTIWHKLKNRIKWQRMNSIRWYSCFNLLISWQLQNTRLYKNLI